MTAYLKEGGRCVFLFFLKTGCKRLRVENLLVVERYRTHFKVLVLEGDVVDQRL